MRTTHPGQARARRTGIAGLLAVASSWGVFWGGWAALIPDVKASLALTDQQLGLALFAVPVAAVPAMLFTGRLARRTAQHTLPIVTVAFAAGIVLTAVAPSRLLLTAALLVVGGASGAIEVALNASTAAYEARHGRRLFNKVHAATPLAMVLAAPAAGLARQWGASTAVALLGIALLVAVSAALAVERRGWHEAEPVDGAAQPRRSYGPVLLLAGALGGTALVLENAVEQWGAIHLERQLGAGPLLASLAPTAYMAGLSVGRMLAQWRGDRYGDRFLVMLGGAVGGVGIVVAAGGWSTVSTLGGFALAGIGLAPVVPALLAATGRSVPARQRAGAIAVVTTVCYAGFLSSPPLVGTLASWLNLSTALAVVAVCAVPVLGAAYVLPIFTGRPVPPEEATGGTPALRLPDSPGDVSLRAGPPGRPSDDS